MIGHEGQITSAIKDCEQGGRENPQFIEKAHAIYNCLISHWSILIVFLAILPNYSFFQSNNFKSLMRYDIKGISINGKLVCPFNGFIHGTLDYGIYKQRGFYFALTNDNAVFGNNLMLFETVSFENFDNEKGKGMDCTLVQMDYGQNGTVKARFWEKDDIVYFTITDKVEGEDVTMVYIMIPNTK